MLHCGAVDSIKLTRSLEKIGSEAKLNQFLLNGVEQLATEDDTELGRGSYGWVVEMRFRGLKCAGKKFYRDLHKRNGARTREECESIYTSRCYDECLLLSSLKHPNIVQFLGIAKDRDNYLPILVMEYVPFTLSRSLEEHGKFPLPISLGILVDVAMGVRYLHENNPQIIHRDLSANNVLLTSEMKAKIADLGMARILNATPAMSKCPGTSTYMPPEVFVECPEYRTEIDLFSYGVLLLHVLCGEWPHPGKAKEHKHGALVAHSEYMRRKKYISKLGDDHPMLPLIGQCLNDEPTKRPNAEQILDYVQKEASKCPRQFDSIFCLLKRLEELSSQLKQTCEHQKTLQKVNSEVLLKYDILNSQLQQGKEEYILLKRKLEEERKANKCQKSQFEAKLKLKQEAHAGDLKALRDKEKLLESMKREISSLNIEIEAMKSEIDQKAKDVEMMRLREQYPSYHAQLDLRESTKDSSFTRGTQIELHDFAITEVSTRRTKMASNSTEFELLLEKLRQCKEDMTSQIKINEEKEAITRGLQSELNSLRKQIDSLQQQLETTTMENGTMKLELDIAKSCGEILKDELELKDSYTKELERQQTRAQELLWCKVRQFS